MHRRDTIFKAHHVQIKSLWIFYCRSKGSDGPRKIWAMTDYTHIIYKVSVWMGAMPRWNLLLLLPPKHKYKDIVCKWELPITIFAHRTHWYFRDHTQARGTEVRHSGCVVVISYIPPRSDPNKNFVCGQKIQATNTFCRARVALADTTLRSPELIKQVLESFLPDEWTLVI